MKTVGIIDCARGGNIASIQNAINKVGGTCMLIKKPEDFIRASKIVIPGVGSFQEFMQELDSKKLLNELKKIRDDQHVLGICLGMQVLVDIGFEGNESQGLGLLDGEVKAMDTNYPLPHMGFEPIKVTADNKLLQGLDNREFYFMHSFEVTDSTCIASESFYGDYKFISSIYKNNIYGVQFHPEKSRESGLKLFKNFLNL